MGTKLFTVLVDSKLITEEQVANHLLQYAKNFMMEYYEGEKQNIPIKIPSVGYSYSVRHNKGRLYSF